MIVISNSNKMEFFKKENRLLERLRNTVTNTDTLEGKVFDLSIQVLIVFSLIMFCLETVPELGKYHKLFYTIEIITVTIFTIEYVLRVSLSQNRIGFIFSIGGLIDLLAILPFFLTLGTTDLTFIRIFRLFRIFRIFKIGKFSKAFERFVKLFRDLKEELLLFTIATMFLLFIASAGIYFFEHDAQPDKFRTIFDAMWWSVATLTTVGYGDTYPITAGGKFFTFIMLMLGLGIVSIPSGLIASGLTKAMQDEKSEE